MNDYNIRICKKCRKMFMGSEKTECPSCHWTPHSTDAIVTTRGTNEIDELMAPVIKKLLDKGYRTTGCCSSHIYIPGSHQIRNIYFGINGRPYISFEPFKVNGVENMVIPDPSEKEALREFGNQVCSKLKNHGQKFFFKENNNILSLLFEAYEKGDECSLALTPDLMEQDLEYYWLAELSYDITQRTDGWYIAPFIGFVTNRYYMGLSVYNYFIDFCKIMHQIEKDIDKYMDIRSDHEDCIQYNEITSDLILKIKTDCLHEGHKRTAWDFDNTVMEEIKIE